MSKEREKAEEIAKGIINSPRFIMNCHDKEDGVKIGVRMFARALVVARQEAFEEAAKIADCGGRLPIDGGMWNPDEKTCHAMAREIRAAKEIK